jgi:hypothetical protein
VIQEVHCIRAWNVPYSVHVPCTTTKISVWPPQKNFGSHNIFSLLPEYKKYQNTKIRKSKKVNIHKRIKTRRKNRRKKTSKRRISRRKKAQAKNKKRKDYTKKI